MNENYTGTINNNLYIIYTERYVSYGDFNVCHNELLDALQ